MSRFTLILDALPSEVPEALSELLLKISGEATPSDLPVIIADNLDESVAKIYVEEFESLGASVEMLPDEREDFTNLSLDDLTTQLEQELEGLKKDNEAESATFAVQEISLQEIPLTEPVSKSASPSSALPASVNELAFSFDEPQQIPLPSSKETKSPEGPVPKKPAEDPFADLSLSFTDDSSATLSTALQPEAVPAAVLESPEPPRESEPAPAPHSRLDPFKRRTESVDAVSEDEPRSFEDDDEYDDLEQEDPQNRRMLFVGAGVAAALLLLLGWFLFGPSPQPAGVQVSGDLVQALLDEQQRIISEERKKALQEQSALTKPTETFIDKVNFGVFRGELHFARYPSGIALESFQFGEEYRERLTPQQLAKGLHSRAWIKSIVYRPPASAKQLFGAGYSSEGDAFARIEDDLGTDRVPVRVELHCATVDEAKLNCRYRVRNPGGDLKDELLVRRDPRLIFELSLNGEFQGVPVSEEPHQ